MKILIIEDETAASENLIAMLQEIDSSAEVLEVLESVEQTINWFSRNEAPDLIFMDIHLSDGSAFSIFDKIEIETPIIFTTAYDQYALSAFAVNSIDYLLKPIKTTDLTKALDKYKRWSRNDIKNCMEQLMKLRPEHTEYNDYKNSLLVPLKDKLLPINVDDVACFYSTERRTQIFMKNKEVYDYNKSLDNIISKLDPNRFLRANKQYIIAKDSVKEIVIWFDNRLLIKLPVETPEPLYISKNKAAEFKNWMTK